MSRILYVTYYWPPSGGAGVQRGLKFVKYLPESGLDPVVLTVDPDSASYPTLDPSLLADVAAPVEVVRTRSTEPLRMLAAIGGKGAVPHAGFAGTRRVGPLQRAMRWVRGNWMIPDARRGWVKHAVTAAARIIERDGINTIVISSPPHSSQLIGLELKRRFPHLRWIADLRDPWTDIYYAKELHQGERAKRLNARWEERVMKQADALVVVGPGMARSFTTRYGAVVGKKITVIPNGYDRADVERVERPALPSDRFRITYVGTVAASYDPRMFFRAVAGVRKSHPEVPFELRFIGSAGDDVREMARIEGVDDVCAWHAAVPHDAALQEMMAAHLLLLLIPTGDGADRILTGKLFEYLAVERPIIGVGPVHGDAASIIDECTAGRMFDRSMGAEMQAWLDERVVAWRKGDALRVTGGLHQRYERRVAAGALADVITGQGR